MIKGSNIYLALSYRLKSRFYYSLQIHTNIKNSIHMLGELRRQQEAGGGEYRVLQTRSDMQMDEKAFPLCSVACVGKLTS
jgi:hypothetical protein